MSCKKMYQWKTKKPFLSQQGWKQPQEKISRKITFPTRWTSILWQCCPLPTSSCIAFSPEFYVKDFIKEVDPPEKLPRCCTLCIKHLLIAVHEMCVILFLKLQPVCLCLTEWFCVPLRTEARLGEPGKERVLLDIVGTGLQHSHLLLVEKNGCLANSATKWPQAETLQEWVTKSYDSSGGVFQPPF